MRKLPLLEDQNRIQSPKQKHFCIVEYNYLPKLVNPILESHKQLNLAEGAKFQSTHISLASHQF